MSITSIVNDTVTSVSFVNAQKPLPPTISGYSVGGLDDTALDPAGGQTVQINGTGFLAGATITFDGSAVAVVTYVNSNQLTFTSPAKSAGTYTIYVVNPDGGTAIYIPGIIYSVLPTWTTSAGTLGSYYETTSISNTVVASGDAPITYSLYSGSLPTGSTLYANGVITGTAPVDSSSTTYSFTIQATDAQLQDSTRSFSLTINTDVVTWVSPANATTYTSAVDSAIANVTLSATDAAGYAVSYSANALPTGLSLSGANISGTPTVIADSSTLLTATAATTNRSATRTINWSITVANDPFFEYNTLLIPGASTTFVDDASTNNFAVTINGDTKPNNFNPYTPGYYSNYFDGTGDYLTCTTIPTFNTGNFTIEGWVYASSVNNCGFFQLNTSAFGGTGGLALAFYAAGGGINTYYAGTTGSGAVSVYSNTWYHFALSRSGTSLKVFINGALINTFTDSTNYTISTLVVGGYYSSSYLLSGYISNFRIVNGTAVYTSAFTPSTTPLTAISGTSFLTSQSNRFIDTSTNNFTITVNGNTTVNSFDPFVPNSSYSTYGSGYFDGTGDYLSTPNNIAFGFGTGDYTMEAWIYSSTAGGRLFEFSSNSDNIDIDTSTGTVNYYNGSSSATSAGGLVNQNTWSHIAVVRLSGTVRVYVNGVLAVTQASTPNSSSRILYIGGITNNFFAGYINNVRVVKGTAVYTANFTPPTAPLTAISGTSLLTLQNNQSVNNNVFLDNSSNNLFVTRNGNTTQGTFSPYGGNWSNYFDGSGDYLSVPTTSGKLNQTGDFTYDMWVFWNVMPTTGYQNIAGQGTGGQSSYGLMAGNAASNTWSAPYVFKLNVANSGDVLNGNTTLVAGQWYHLAHTRTSGVNRLFVNGVVQTNTYTDNTSRTFAGNPYLITDGNSNCYMSNFRFIQGTSLYTTSFTPPSTPLTPITGTQLLTSQSNRLIDNSINNLTITKVGDTKVQRFSPFNPSSLTPTSYSGYFDGTGDYLTVPTNSVFDFGTGDFTIEAWVNPTTLPTDCFIIASTGAGGLFFGSNGGLFGWGRTDVEWTYRAGTPTLNTWQHVALSRSGTNMRLFVNGTQVGTTQTNSVSYNLSVTSTSIGSLSTNYYWNGYISNLRVVKGTAVYTTTFTPSTTPLTAIANTSLLTLQSTTFIDNSTNNFTISAFGNSQPSIQNPFGYTSATTNGYTVSTIGGSGYFDGSGDDYLQLASNSAFQLGTGDFTVDFWYYPAVINLTNNPFIDTRTGSGSGSGLLIRLGDGGSSNPTYVYASVGGSNTAFQSGLVGSQWNHIAVTRSGGSTVRVFINGVSGATGSSATNLSNNGLLISRFIDNSNGINGYLSDVRIIKGQALYTSNFVPPTSPLTAVQNSSLLLNMTSGGIIDYTMMNNMETVADTQLSTAVSKFGGSSISFDGTGDQIKIPSPNHVVNFGTGNFTVEFWIYLNTVPSNTAGILSSYTGGNFYINFRASGNIALTDATTEYARTASALTAGSWFHIAVVRSSSSSKIYTNGIGGTAVACTTDWQATALLYVGGDPNGSFNGYIDDMRVTKGYARYTSNFTPPTSAFQLY